MPINQHSSILNVREHYLYECYRSWVVKFVFITAVMLYFPSEFSSLQPRKTTEVEKGRKRGLKRGKTEEDKKLRGWRQPDAFIIQ